MTETMVERVARAIAQGLGDDFDHAFTGKSEWISERGEKGGRLRDVNEPMQSDYLEAARAAIEAMSEPTEAMVETACKSHKAGIELSNGRECTRIHNARFRWQAMITAALGEGK